MFQKLEDLDREQLFEEWTPVFVVRAFYKNVHNWTMVTYGTDRNEKIDTSWFRFDHFDCNYHVGSLIKNYNYYGITESEQITKREFICKFVEIANVCIISDLPMLKELYHLMKKLQHSQYCPDWFKTIKIEERYRFIIKPLPKAIPIDMDCIYIINHNNSTCTKCLFSFYCNAVTT